MNNQKETVKWFVVLHAIILIFSINSICSKTAGVALNDKDYVKALLFYGVVICILGFYAIAWQQVLKHLPLITAYANKAVTTLWGLVWGYIVFGEKVTLIKIVGAAIVIFGVYLVVTGDESVQLTEKKSDKEEQAND